jgi:hypothetical protein
MSCLSDGNMVLITADSYSLPWSLVFQKHHITHVFLLKYDFDKKLIDVIDSFSSDVIMELEDLNGLIIKECSVVNILKKCNNIDLHIVLKKKYMTILESNIKNGVYNLIKDFADELWKIDSIEKLTKNSDDLLGAILLRRLNYIVNSRYNTKSFFEYLQLSDKFIDDMNEIYIKWESVKNMFIKVLISKRLNLLSKISQELLVIADLEKDLCNRIIDSVRLL